MEAGQGDETRPGLVPEKDEDVPGALLYMRSTKTENPNSPLVEEYDLSTGTGGTWTAGNSLISGARTFAAGQDTVSGVLYKGAGWAGAYLTGAESSAYVVPVELMHFTID